LALTPQPLADHGCGDVQSFPSGADLHLEA
jgi:hypothetical protein